MPPLCDRNHSVFIMLHEMHRPKYNFSRSHQYGSDTLTLEPMLNHTYNSHWTPGRLDDVEASNVFRP